MSFVIPALKTVYMGGGTGRFLSRVYMRMFLPGTILPGTICKVSIISSRLSGTECLYDKNCPALAGSRFAGTGRKTCRQNSFHINGMGQIRDIYMHGEIPFYVPSRRTSRPGKRPVPANVPSRLPYKQPLRVLLRFVNC